MSNQPKESSNEDRNSTAVCDCITDAVYSGSSGSGREPEANANQGILDLTDVFDVLHSARLHNEWDERT